MAVIRYIAFISETPEELAKFYNRFLGTRELGRSPEGDVSISDGFYNLTFFKRRPSLQEPRTELGLNHIGLQVENLEEVKARYLDFNPRGALLSRSPAIFITARSVFTTSKEIPSAFRKRSLALAPPTARCPASGTSPTTPTTPKGCASSTARCWG